MKIIRLTLFSILLCGLIYVPAIFAFANALVPIHASGSLITDNAGKTIGSRLIAQSFTEDRYFHPRPSACDHNAAGAAGSNLSPNNPELTERAKSILAGYQGTGPIPADLVTASGSGLDPHITRAAAIYQISRISSARNVPVGKIETLIPRTDIINVLELNLALDRSVR